MPYPEEVRQKWRDDKRRQRAGQAAPRNRTYDDTVSDLVFNS